jgi:predicted O-methyltransferase YrrM
MRIINRSKRSLLHYKELLAIPKAKDSTLSDQEISEEDRVLFQLIKTKHTDYIKNISSPDMAMSLELACFLFAFCRKNKPVNLLDLGSGFSSYIFRLYQKNCKYAVAVHSIDDHSEWLKKTEQYLSEQDVSSDHLYNLISFKESARPSSYDLILLDLNYVEKRKDYIDFSAELLKPEGSLIVDDVHKIEFLRDVKNKAKKNNYKLFNIKKQTKDSFGRFSILLTK